jgi:hypothetical protein
MKAEGGNLISELGELTEGNIRIDLCSFSVERSTLSTTGKEKSLTFHFINIFNSILVC